MKEGKCEFVLVHNCSISLGGFCLCYAVLSLYFSYLTFKQLFTSMICLEIQWQQLQVQDVLKFSASV